jgi:hypothetical protein
MMMVLAGRGSHALYRHSLRGRPGEHAPDRPERMPNTSDVSTRHGRLEAERPTHDTQAHHDDATFSPPAPPCLAAG